MHGARRRSSENDHLVSNFHRQTNALYSVEYSNIDKAGDVGAVSRGANHLDGIGKAAGRELFGADPHYAGRRA
jgi:hypothetical protein